MRVFRTPWWLLPVVSSCLLAGCDEEYPPTGPAEEEELPSDIVLVTGTVSTPIGNRVEFVNVRLFGVYGDSLNPSYDQLDADTTDAAGAFLVEYSDCMAYPRFFVDLEIACFPIGLREVGCGAWDFTFIWNPPGGLLTPGLCWVPARIDPSRFSSDPGSPSSLFTPLSGLQSGPSGRL